MMTLYSTYVEYCKYIVHCLFIGSVRQVAHKPAFEIGRGRQTIRQGESEGEEEESLCV